MTPGKGKYPASFRMGSDDIDSGKPVHDVTFDYSFAIAKYEVTQELYEAVMGKNPSRWKGPAQLGRDDDLGRSQHLLPEGDGRAAADASSSATRK